MTYLYCRKVHILTSECYISLQKILLNTGASHTTSPPVFLHQNEHKGGRTHDDKVAFEIIALRSKRRDSEE